MPTLRVVLDTNVLVSGFAYPGSIPGKILGAWRQGSLMVVLSRHILDELQRSLPRVNHRLRWQPQDFEDQIETLKIQAALVEPDIVPPGTVRDAGDLLVLGTLLASKADYLITGDGDLISLAAKYSTIITPAEFWRKHGA